MHKKDSKAKYTRELTVVDYIHDYNIDTEKNEIYLFGEEDYGRAFEGDEPGVEFMMANRFIKNLRVLSSLNDDPILVHMKTNGGMWMEGMAIYQAICACPNYITILNYTHARSMSSIILQAADNRVMMPYSHFMYHDGTCGTDGTVKQYFTEAVELKKSMDQMMDIYLDQAENGEFFKDKTRKQIANHMRRQMDKKEEVYLTAQETVEQGLADAIFGQDDKYDWTTLRG